MQITLFISQMCFNSKLKAKNETEKKGFIKIMDNIMHLISLMHYSSWLALKSRFIIDLHIDRWLCIFEISERKRKIKSRLLWILILFF